MAGMRCSVSAVGLAWLKGGQWALVRGGGPSGSFAGGAVGSSPRGVSLRRRPAGSSTGGAAGFVLGDGPKPEEEACGADRWGS